jgi:glycosyltransferase involved in cell wall biosynthesis
VLIGSGGVRIPPRLSFDILDLGFVTPQDKADAYAATLALCQPSLLESFSLVMMEAWLRAPPAGPRAVRGDAVTASARTAASSSRTTSSSSRRWSSWRGRALRQRMARPARLRLANYTWDRVTDNYLAVLRQLEPGSRDPAAFRAVHQLVSNFDLGTPSATTSGAPRAPPELGLCVRRLRPAPPHESPQGRTLLHGVPGGVLARHGGALPLLDRLEVTSFFAGLPDRRAMVYHNITPPEYFVGVNVRVADRCRRGRWELARLRNVAELALGVSEFNRQELEGAGFRRTGVLPILVDWEQYAHPRVPALEEAYGRGTSSSSAASPRNKRVDNLIKAYYFYRRLDPDSRLIVVGSAVTPRPISRAVRKLCAELGLLDHVVFAGSVSQAEPTIDSRQPTSALRARGLLRAARGHALRRRSSPAAAGVPDTMGDAGLLVHERTSTIAELTHRVVHDPGVRRRRRGSARPAPRLDAEIGATLRGHLETSPARRPPVSGPGPGSGWPS